MTPRDALGPFQPGPGGMPPHLGGREEEQRLFRALLTRMEDRARLPAEVILYGPRGNGKTVLLRWLEDEAASRRGIETVVLLPSSIPNEGRLAERLLPRSWWDRLTPEQVALAGFSWRPGRSGASPPPPEDVLTARARKAPLLVVMDEAHTLDIGVGRALLNASQLVRARHPFLLVLAGTPNLESRLAKMEASFWSRAEQLRIGRLDERAVADALRRPFEATGIRVRNAVLAEMVRLSQGYPYFVQLLGQKAWGEARGESPRAEESAELTPEALERARTAFEQRQRDYCRHGYRELEEIDLLPAARAVAEAFAGRAVLDTSRLRRAIAAGLRDSEDARENAELARAQRALADLGFVWSTSPDPGWTPGIPSLMKYVLEFA